MLQYNIKHMQSLVLPFCCIYRTMFHFPSKTFWEYREIQYYCTAPLGKISDVFTVLTFCQHGISQVISFYKPNP